MLAVIFLSVLFVMIWVCWILAEFVHHQNGHDTWDWIVRLYNFLGADRIRW